MGLIDDLLAEVDAEDPTPLPSDEDREIFDSIQQLIGARRVDEEATENPEGSLAQIFERGFRAVQTGEPQVSRETPQAVVDPDDDFLRGLLRAGREGGGRFLLDEETRAQSPIGAVLPRAASNLEPTLIDQLAEIAGESAPAALAGAGQAAIRGASAVGSSALAAPLSPAATSVSRRAALSSAQALLETAGEGRFSPEELGAGAVLGGALPLVGDVLGRIGRRTIEGRPTFQNAPRPRGAPPRGTALPAGQHAPEPLALPAGTTRAFPRSVPLERLGPGARTATARVPAGLLPADTRMQRLLGPGSLRFDALRGRAAQGDVDAFKDAVVMLGGDVRAANDALTALRTRGPDDLASNMDDFLSGFAGRPPSGRAANTTVEAEGLRRSGFSSQDTEFDAFVDDATFARAGDPDAFVRALGRVGVGARTAADISAEIRRGVEDLDGVGPAFDEFLSQFGRADVVRRAGSGQPPPSGAGRRDVSAIGPAVTVARREVADNFRASGASPEQARAAASRVDDPVQVIQAQRADASRAAERVGRTTGGPEPGRNFTRAPVTRSGRSGSNEFETIDRVTQGLDDQTAARLREQGGSILHRVGRTLNPLTWFYNGVLLNPKTLATNMFGNLEQIAEESARRALRAGFSPTQQAAQLHAFFMSEGMGQAMRNAWRSFRTGDSAFGIGLGEISSMSQGPAKNVYAGMDDFFTTLGYYMELHDQAFRDAASRGLRGRAAVRAAHDFVAARARPNMKNLAKLDDASNAALRSARRVVFRDIPIADDLIKGGRSTEARINRIIEDVQEVPVLGRYVLPFGKTLFRIGKRSLEISPLGYGRALHLAMRKDFGNSALAAMRATVGLPIYGTAAALAMSDRLTGELSHLTPGERRIAELDGVKPFSIRIGDRWFSYRNLGPAALALRFVADTTEDLKKGAQVEEAIEKAYERGASGEEIEALQQSDPFRNVVAGTGRTIGNFSEALLMSTFLPGVVELLSQAVDPDQSRGNPAQRQLASFVQPIGIAASAVAATDPAIRQPETIGEEVSLRVPGADRTEVQPILDPFGQPRQRQGGSFAERFLSPFPSTPASTDPFVNELARLRIGITSPNVRVRKEAGAIGETEKAAADRALGAMRERVVREVIRSRDYGSLTDEQRKQRIENAVRRASATINKRVQALRAARVPLTERVLLEGF